MSSPVREERQTAEEDTYLAPCALLRLVEVANAGSAGCMLLKKVKAC